MSAVQLSGPEKAVLLLLSLDEAAASPIVSELNPEDVRKLREVATQMNAIPASALDQVYGEFVAASQHAVAVPRGGLSYLRRLSTRALGETQTQQIFGEAPPSALERIQSADASTLAGVLESEHPQLIAALLSQVDTKQAADVLQRLPEQLRPGVLQRLGSLTEVPAGLLESIAEAITAELPQTSVGAARSVDGVGRSAALVRSLNKELSDSLLAELESTDEDLAVQIRRSMYSFEDLKLIDPKSMRELLKAVAGDRLTLALKTASDEMKNHIFSGMSKRAAERIREDLEILGAVRLADVEQAQQEIVETALRLASEGTISLGDSGEALV